MAALSASRLVCSAMEVMTSTTLPIDCVSLANALTAWPISLTASCMVFMALRLCRASSLPSRVNWSASEAACAVLMTFCVTS
ncbi:hypothetical protein D3C78_1792420 [compost metagenome]